MRFVGATAFVFVAFVLRATFSAMSAVARQWRQIDESCLDICECHNVYAHITVWLAYTPEFQLVVILVSSPLALLVALWGMTSKATLYLMKSSQRETALSLNPTKSVLLK